MSDTLLTATAAPVSTSWVPLLPATPGRVWEVRRLLASCLSTLGQTAVRFRWSGGADLLPGLELLNTRTFQLDLGPHALAGPEGEGLEVALVSGAAAADKLPCTAFATFYGA